MNASTEESPTASRLAILAATLTLACSATGGGDASSDGAGGGPDGVVEQETLGDLPVATNDGSVQAITPGRYLRPAPLDAEAALVLEGLANITIDMSGVEVRGQDASADRDDAQGLGLLLRNCRDVTLRGGLFGGYRGCIVLEECTDVTLERIRFDAWYAQRLRSTTYSEDLSDWLRPHENDEGEWLAKYGGAISVTDSTGITIKNCRGRRGQNGILLTRVRGCEVYDNDFSFMSGWGLAMYRSNENTISHNVFDYCVRGYSHEVYSRGQDSAGILMFERCCDNVIARNSATHGGDGVFLYGGQDIVELGLDDATGSDRNLFFENDLRYSPANSLEATFSRGNVAIRNRMSGSYQHGVWGGYSSEMVIVDNEIDDTIQAAITIEHGQECVIADNRIAGNENGVELYWDADPHLVDGAFGRKHDTSSRDHWIVRNRFENNVLDLVVRETTGLVFHANAYVPGRREPYFERIASASDPTLDAGTVQRWLDALDGAYPSGNLTDVTLDPWIGEVPPVLAQWRAWEAPDVPGAQEVRAEHRDEFGGGLESIVMGEWGPWDFRSGEPRPAIRKAGGLLSECRWSATWFRWRPGESDPRTNEAAFRANANAPVVRETVDTFVNPWGNKELQRAIGNDHFGLFAQTRFEIERSGRYRVSVNSDDGIRILVDGEVVLEDWTHHAPQRDEATIELERGPHSIRIEYFQIQGAAALVVELHPEE